MKNFNNSRTLVIVTLLLLICSFVSMADADEIALYVSPEGNDSWAGDSIDKPFATIQKARDAIRAIIKAGSLPEGGITVNIRGGIYPISKTLKLTAEDSGAEGAPIVWRAYPGEIVRFNGGKVLTGFEPISDQSILRRIDKAYHDKILQADLKKQGVTNYGEMKQSGYALPVKPMALELFFNGHPMTLARYPNEEWLTIKEVPQTGELKYEGTDLVYGIPRGRHYGRLAYEGDRPNRWVETGDIWMYGYWSYNWADMYQRIEKIDTQKHEIHLAEPYHQRGGVAGYTKGQRYYYLNILEELDSPGEWYLDRTSGMLYFWPPTPVEKGEAYVSLLQELMISLEGTSYITIQGIVFEVTRASVIKVEGGAHNTIAGCTMCNVGNLGIIINGGTQNGAISCDISETGDGGIIISGGNRRTLTPAGNYAINNHIHNYCRIDRTYRPAIRFSGVGNHISHNRLHDGPHQAVSWSGNEHIFEFNEVYDVTKETNDSAAMYSCCNPTTQGSIIRYNYWHHIKESMGYGSAAVYFDDGVSGNTVFGNVFYKACVSGTAGFGAVFVHGGRYHTVENNIFIECEQAYGESRWTDENWENAYERSWKRRLYEDIDVSQPPYSTRYPWLENLKYDKRLTVVSKNLVYRCDRFLGKGKQELVDNFVTDEDPGFVNASDEDFMLRDSSYVYDIIPGFQKIPFDKIGLYVDEYRKILPKDNR